MPNFVLLNQDNVVVNIIVADSLEIAREICGGNIFEQTEEMGHAGPGMIWNGTSFINSEL